MLQGEQGGDRVVFDDALDTGNDTYNFNAGSFFKSNVPAQIISHNTIEHLEFNGSPGQQHRSACRRWGSRSMRRSAGFAGADTFNHRTVEAAR
jgi:hypothetical protein